MIVNKFFRLIVVFIVLLGSFSFSVRRSYACSCAVDPSLTAREQHLANLNRPYIEVVFVGTVVEIDDPHRARDIISSADLLDVRFEVEALFKGEAGSTIEVKTFRDEASCGYNFTEGGRYLVFIDGDSKTDFCSGNIASPSANILVLLGDATPPTVTDVQVQPETPAAREWSPIWIWTGIGALILLSSYVAFKKSQGPNIG